MNTKHTMNLFDLAIADSKHHAQELGVKLPERSEVSAPEHCEFIITLHHTLNTERHEEIDANDL